MLPSTLTQLLLTLTFVVPGFVYQSVRISFRGRLPNDVELSTRLVRAIVTSAIFALLYIVVFGDVLVDAARDETQLFNSVRLGALYAFVGGIAFPAIVAATAGLIRAPDWEWLTSLRAKMPEIARYDPTPTAWDKVFQDRGPTYVRILNSEGRWIGGYFGTESYASSFPEDHQVYLERTHSIDETGVLGDEIPGTRGCIVNCADLQLLELLEPEDGDPEGGPS